LAALVWRSKNKGRVLMVNLLIGGTYSLVFLYNLYYNSSGGTALGWLVYLMCILGFHALVLLVGVLRDI
jgi:hypothetical protein